jgi:4a-hydroxytetrahydrobiopterin dehydratase
MQGAKFSPEEVESRLQSVSGWSVDSGGTRLVKQWRMKDFASALAFLQRIGQLAEKLDHHPDLHLERYRFVRVELWTHAAGGITALDFLLAKQIDELSQGGN